ncbi:MAG TPA: helix-turn-helix domain-containing protein [Geminicoccaceae bacterium]|nr:helix-turn-helix domain-containing protein [Geminicoccaceae bacterium]
MVKDTLLPHGRYLVTKAMGERGLSVTTLAATLGISRKHLSNVLNAAVPLGEGLAERLALALDLDPGDLIILRHDGVVPPPLDSIEPMKIEILGDPNEPILGWFED